MNIDEDVNQDEFALNCSIATTVELDKACAIVNNFLSSLGNRLAH